MSPRQVGEMIRLRPMIRNRVLASVSYLGPVSLLVVAALPRSRFVQRHAQRALALHLARVAWSGTVIVGWSLAYGPVHAGSSSWFAANLGMLVLTGFPWFGGMNQSLIFLLSLPLGATWLLGLAGAFIAATGHTIDHFALLHADWSDDPPPLPSVLPPARDEREYARELRERQLERVWSASLVAQAERRRREQVEELRSAMETVLVRLDHLNRLLSLGEITLSRFTAMHAEIIGYLDQLRRALTDIQTRRSDALSGTVVPPPPSALAGVPEVRVLTLAILDHGGVPIVTAGYFPLDESLITGMVSALDSLSEEMFGARVHKSQLAQGQVVYFTRGRLTSAFAIFEDEPAPNQIVRLREYVDAFEETNAEALATIPVDAARLTTIAAPFEFARRLQTEAPAPPNGRQPVPGDD
ncbi:MAG TPA: hypothetical protein VMU89_05325 [Thermomicrobiaceae bacterium]|nr:hypothetical protein [Thermomicrobiaceae bacterium]